MQRKKSGQIWLGAAFDLNCSGSDNPELGYLEFVDPVEKDSSCQDEHDRKKYQKLKQPLPDSRLFFPNDENPQKIKTR